MSRTVLADVDGFTPLIDFLIQEHGLVTAAVFGRVWRYCQGQLGVCNASIDTIATGLGIDYRTALRHVKTLVDTEYLRDMTPNLRNRPHSYTDTGKAGIKITISTLPESQSTLIQSQSTLTLSQSHSDLESVKDTSKKEVKKPDPAAVAAAPPSPLTPGQRMFLAAFGAKRFSNGLQAQTIADLEIHFGYERLAEVVAWAAKKGMARGQAIAAIEKAIPTWGQPKGNGASGMPGKQIGPQNEPASWGAIRAWAEKENVYGDEG